MLSANAGVFVAFLIGAFMHFTVVPYFGLVVSVIFLVSLFFIPESPPYLINNKRFEQAEKASVFYNGGVAVSTEDKMEMQIDTKPAADVPEQSNKITFDDFRKSAIYLIDGRKY